MLWLNLVSFISYQTPVSSCHCLVDHDFRHNAMLCGSSNGPSLDVQTGSVPQMSLSGAAQGRHMNAQEGISDNKIDM